jgi:hypothetical protein
MSGDELSQVLAGQDDDVRLRLAAGGVAAGWVYDELRETWRDAQAQAQRAYADWRDGDIPHAYAVYRAAQDRADAAHDALARRHRDALAQESR